MSFDINWDTLVADATLTHSIQQFLDEQLNGVALPAFIDKLAVTDFLLGTTPPKVTLRHIGNPFDDFYDSSDDEAPHVSDSVSDSDSDSDLSLDQPGESAPVHVYSMNNVGLGPPDLATNFFSGYRFRSGSVREPARSENDIQFVVDVDYRGDISIEIAVSLLVNYPLQHFISLPIKLRVTDLVVHSLAAVAYLHNSVFVTVLCDLNDLASDYFTSSNHPSHPHDLPTTAPAGGNFVDYASTSNRERIDVIKLVKIDTEIGEVESNVLRNVGKVEKFLVEQIRSIIRDEIAWPSWLCFDLSEEET